MKVGSKASVHLLFVVITAVIIQFVYYDFFVTETSMFYKSLTIALALFFIWKTAQSFSLHIKIKDGNLSIKSMRHSAGVGLGIIRTISYAFPVSSVTDVHIERQSHEQVLGVSDPYLGKGRATLSVTWSEGTAKIFLDTFDVKKVDKFLEQNFPTRIRR